MMMKRFSKGIALFVLMFVVLTAVAGCGNSAGTKESEGQTTATPVTSGTQAKVEEPLTIKYFTMNNTRTAPEKDNAVYKWLKENKNIDIQVEVFSDPNYDKTTEKMNLMLASKDIPDVFGVITGTANNEIVNKWGEAGLVIPMDDWIAKYPEFTKSGDSKYNDVVYRDKKDGKMYMIPTNYCNTADRMGADIGPFIREDWLKQVGMNAPKTTDELYAVLKAFKDKIPDVDGKKIIPISGDDYRSLMFFAWSHFVYWLSPDNKFNWFFMDPEIEGYMVYMNKLYLDGLLDKECFTQKFEDYMAKLSSGRVGFTTRVYADMDNANKALKAKGPGMRFVPSPPIQVSGKDYMPAYQQPTPNAYSGVTVSTEFAKDAGKLERLMEFLKWETSEEGIKITNYGPDDMYYTTNNNGQIEMKAEAKTERDQANSTFYQKSGLTFYNIINEGLPSSRIASDRTEEAKMCDVWKTAWSPLIQPVSLTVTGPLEQQKLGTLIGEFNKWSAKAIYAKSEEECRKATKEMLKAFETNGGRDITNERQKAIDEFVAKNK